MNTPFSAVESMTLWFCLPSDSDMFIRKRNKRRILHPTEWILNGILFALKILVHESWLYLSCFQHFVSLIFRYLGDGGGWFFFSIGFVFVHAHDGLSHISRSLSVVFYCSWIRFKWNFPGTENRKAWKSFLDVKLVWIQILLFFNIKEK